MRILAVCVFLIAFVLRVCWLALRFIVMAFAIIVGGRKSKRRRRR